MEARQRTGCLEHFSGKRGRFGSLRKHAKGLFEVMAFLIHLSMCLGFFFKDLILNFYQLERS